MAYLRFNSYRLNRIPDDTPDFVILSQVIGSQSSYEIPRKVKTEEDLIGWYGTKWPEFEYARELLRKGATLLLYKPVSTEKREDTESYIDYSGYRVNTEEIYESEDDIPLPLSKTSFGIMGPDGLLASRWIYDLGLGWKEIPLDSEDYVDYEQYFTDLDQVPVDVTLDYEHTIFQVSGDTSAGVFKYVWDPESGTYVNIEWLPQNISVADRSKSWNNRDTLALGSPETGKDIYVSHPRFSESDIPEELVLSENDKREVGYSYSQKHVEDKETYTYAVGLDFGQVTEFTGNDYICFRLGPDKVPHMIYFDSYGDIPSTDYVGERNRHFIDRTGKTVPEIVSEIWSTLEGCGLRRLGNIYWSQYSMQMEYFYRLSGLKMWYDFRLSYDIVSLASPTPRITFWTRTIGKHESDIKITIEKLRQYGEYQVIVQREGYGSEVHVGSLWKNIDDANSEYLETVINRDSKLVRAKIERYRTDPKTGRKVRWKPLVADHIISVQTEDITKSSENLIPTEIYYNTVDSQYYQNSEVLPNPDLPVGTWTMKGAFTEDIDDPLKYQEGLKCLQESDLKEDFLMIPRMSDYRAIKDLSNYSWYPEYEIIYDYCKTKNVQSVISNNDIGSEVSELPEVQEEDWVYKVGDKYYMNGTDWTGLSREVCNPWLNEFIWNYIKTTDDLRNPHDFDRDNYLSYFYRQIWTGTRLDPAYCVFLDGILTDNHLYSRTNILYNSPVDDPLAYNEPLDIEVALEHKKSNYLVADVKGYYYKNYLNHVGDDNYVTTIMTKFFQSKLSRDFDRNKWRLLGAHTTAEMLGIIERILYSFEVSFELVRSATLEDYQINRLESSASIYVTLRTLELVDKDINLNITLNYTN